jgi:WD40 repeat protein
VLASCTEIESWNAGDQPYALAMAREPGGAAAVLATGGPDGIARIWDPLTGELVRTLTGHRTPIWSVDFGYGPDGQLLLATGSHDGTARIWDPFTGETLHVLTGHTGAVAAVAWGYGSGRPFLVTASQDGTVRIWDPLTGELERALTGRDSGMWDASVAYRADGRALLATVSSDGTVSIWDPDTGRAEDTFTAHDHVMRSVAWGRRPGGEPLLATAAIDPVARVWPDWADSAERTAQELAPDTGDMLALSWAPLDDGRTLLATTTARALHVWDGFSGERLHTVPGEYSGGLNHLDWAMAPTGQLLLAASTRGQVHVWDVVLEPAVRPASVAAASRERVTVRGGRPATILDPPEDVTPAYPDIEGTRKRIERVSCAVRADGHLLAAAVAPPGEIQIWDISTGTFLRILTHPEGVEGAAWWRGADGHPLLATGSNDNTARIWDPDTGELLRTITGHTNRVVSVAWGYRPDGQPLLATGSDDNTARIWDPSNGELLRTITGHTGHVVSVAWGYRRDGHPLLATGSDDNARIWDPDTGELLRTLTGHTKRVWTVAWGYRPDGQPLLATVSGDSTARIWDPDTGQTVRTITGHDDRVYGLEWAQLPDGGQLLASAGGDGTARIWDPDTGDELASVPSRSSNRQAIALIQNPAGDLLMVVANPADEGGPATVWRIATAPDRDPAQHPEPSGYLSPWQADELSGWLLRLGGAGLWVPLGLLADLVELTGQASAVRDGRLAALAGEPGIVRLRELGWAPAARVAFGALLASQLTIPEHYAPPSDAAPTGLRDALVQALAERKGAAQTSPVPVRDVRAAAARISERTVTLLSILGPATCAADPLLPVRLAHRVPQLPALSPRELRLLASTGARRPADGQVAAAGILRYSPGTAGLARTGPLTRLLPTQLALPRDLMTMLLAENQLLYRQHRAPAPPAPEPVTIILDTTPPTFGPAGHVLRLAAHLLATTLWEHDRFPALVTLTNPDTVTELRNPADLTTVWASSTLDGPAPALAAALDTAVHLGQPVLFCTHHHTARGSYTTGPATRLLTAHHTPERPPPASASPWHCHLPPSPTQAQLSQVITRLLTARAAEGN